MYTFRPFVEADIRQMHLVFLDAFADYALPFRLSYEQFLEKFIHKLNINLSLSVGAFYKDELIAFIFTSTDTYLGQKTAYNGGTGVIPKHRGNSLTTRMYEYLWPQLEREGIKHAVLEVITTNERAIKSYQKCGFTIHKLYHCFRLKEENIITDSSTRGIAIVPQAMANWPLYDAMLDWQPSYLDSSTVLKHNIAREHIAEARIGDTVVGYIIFQPYASRISQLAVAESYRGQGIGKSLLAYAFQHTSAKTITWVNIDQHEKEMIQVLKQWGFENTVDQYEMIKRL
jgi:ribosomal protein S18 acetylase RimI-like enzyme